MNPQKTSGSRIHGKYAGFRIQNNKAFLHAVQHGIQLGTLGSQVCHLLRNAVILLLHAAEHGG